ncbi:MAG: trigger factor [Flavobacteriales bacterium]|nr:trigger factor [Flavobacteriales bacterium]
MNVLENKIDELNAVLTVKIAKEDYLESYESSLKKYRKQIQMPGFRPGQVPTAVVKKKYGPSILAEEIDKLLNQALQEHISQNELNILGNPIPKNEEKGEIDWNNPADMEFSFEIGLAPNFELKLDAKSKFPFNKVKVDDQLVDKQIEDFAKRYGKLIPVDKSADKDMIWATFTQLDENDKVVEGGFTHNSTVAIEFLEDAKMKKKLTGLKTGDTLVVDPKSISRGAADMGAMLGISKEQATAYNTNVELKVTEIKRMEPAEVNMELVEKVYGPGNVESVDAMREKISNELSQMFAQDSDRLFKRDFADLTLEKLNLALPNDFLKKWILSSSKEDITMDDIEKEYDSYARSLRWQLIENKIIKDNNIKVDFEEVLNHTKNLLANQYAQYGMMIPVDEDLTANARKILENREEAQKLFEQLYDLKVISFLKDTVKLQEKELSYDDFVKEAQKN